MMTMGKAIAGGIPIGAYGMRRGIADQVLAADVDLEDTGGVGARWPAMRCRWQPPGRHSSTC